MKVTKSNSLASQFYVFIAIITLAAMSINVYIQYSNETRVVNKSLNARVQSIAELLASVSVEALLTYDDVTLDGYARFASKQKDIVFAVVVNQESIPLTHYMDQGNSYLKPIIASNKNIKIKSILDILLLNSDILFYKTPIMFDGKLLAYSWVGLDRSPYNRESRDTLIKILFVTLCVSMFIGGAIYYLFKSKIFQPIKILTRGTRNITNFEFEKEISIGGSGELAVLANSFDKMRLQLKETIESRNMIMSELSDLNDSLEERVHERTLELQILNTKIAHEAMHDPLTGLPNRILIKDQLQHAISTAKRANTTLAVMMIDLNNFKEVNDTLGHPVGDRLLIDVAQRLIEAIRESDMVCRLGGDEFAVILPDINEANAISVAKKIVEHLVPSFAVDDHTLKIGASIGIAMFPEHGKDDTSLIRIADVAMYEAKTSNIGYCIYHPELDKYTPLRLSLMDYLTTALQENQLQLHYQPKIALGKNKISSVEALIRWFQPELGWIFPEQFIPMAENSGLINDLSDWVLEHAFMQWRSWQDQGIDIQIAVNLSARNLVNPELPKRIAQLCERYNMQTNGIKAEITESALMTNPEQVMEIMANPDMQRLSYSIDDFGTGYSSLSYLKKLPVVEVKIDKSFVADMINDENDASIVKSVIDLVHNLGYTVVAEGVENIETLEQLKLLGCDEVQGYLFSKAVPAEELIANIKNIEKIYLTG
jgi:diguanylate cyclase (GGDEF)-like protein